MGNSVTLIAFITAPWQLFAAYLILATGAAAMHTGAITTIVGLWFDRRAGWRSVSRSTARASAASWSRPRW